LGWKVAWECTPEVIQQIVDEAPKAKVSSSDGWEAHASLWYHLIQYQVSQGKSDTYSVEADKAELRHYQACKIIVAFFTLPLCTAWCHSLICHLFQWQTVAQT